MRIGIDARKIRDFGIGTYIEQLINALPEVDPANEYVLFHYPSDRELIPQTAPNLRCVAETAPKYSLRELVSLPLKMGQQQLDLFHAPHYTLPPIRPCRGVVTIHDVIHLRFPQYLPHRAAFWYAKSLMWAAARSAKKIITVSQCSKQDIVRYLGVPEEKVVVVYNGIDVKSREPGEPDASLSKRDVSARFGLDRPYMLYLGNFLPHKNLTTLIKAYALLKRQAQIPHVLVLAGKNDRIRTELTQVIHDEGVEDEVLLTGFVEPEWVSPLYSGAELFVYPSFYEGFGLQVLEAMAHRVPVVIADVAALPEIAGDAAARCDPGSPKSMAEAIRRVLNDGNVKNTLIEQGQRRLCQFSWRAMAEKTVAVYHDVLQETRVR